LEEVNAALDTLNLYADKTIYNFTQMTKNIGTFTAAGVDLQTSVNAIQGIANLAAVSGSTSEQASRAMYQISQGLASGIFDLRDWNSVVNAGMGGKIFQDALSETAKRMGTVIKLTKTEAAEFGKLEVSVEEYISKKSFRESMSKKWVTSEIMTSTLEQFTKEGVISTVTELTKGTESGARAIQDLGSELGWTSKEVKALALEYTHNNQQQADTIIGMMELADRAEKAATEVKTYTQLIDTLKEGMQSGWTQTWELIIGDFNQAKKLWTSVSDVLGSIIQKTSDARNQMLSNVFDTSWDKLIKKISGKKINTDAFTDTIQKDLEAAGYSVDELISDYGTLEEVFRQNAELMPILENALTHVGKGWDQTKEHLDEYTNGVSIADEETAYLLSTLNNAGGREVLAEAIAKVD
ncbi:MAG: tape measure protein, partial [Limosilactobacillus mucosae]|nr:tape measure protein [Limosilactobacillus mucosae]